jgi:hypothetical protein
LPLHGVHAFLVFIFILSSYKIMTRVNSAARGSKAATMQNSTVLEVKLAKYTA